MTAEQAPAPATGRCSDGARRRGDPPLGTAPGGTRWILIEQDADWAPNPLASLEAPREARRDLGLALESVGARPEFVRRPRARAVQRTESLRWGVVDSTLGVEVWGTRDADGGWGGAIEALNDPVAAGAAPGPGTLLVCTHGRHDACCAMRGRPVAAALAAAFPEETWECSHLGGDRFAANLAFMPDGALYGYVDPEEAVELVRAHRAGRVDATHFRGVVGLEPAEQTARTAAAAELGLVPWDRRLTSELHSEPHGHWDVRVRLDGVPALRVTGHVVFREPSPLTCGAPARSAVVPIVDAIASLRA